MRYGPAVNSAHDAVTESFAATYAPRLVGHDRDGSEVSIAAPVSRPSGKGSLLCYRCPRSSGLWTIATKSVSWEATILIEFGAPVLIWALVKAASRLPREFPANTFEDLV